MIIGSRMETFELILMVLAAILVSSVLDRLIPRVSAPLIQIGLGFVIAYFAVSAIPFSLNPDFFLFLFIAPLLFHDAKEADRAALWKYRKKILSLSIGLVFAIMVVIGFVLNLLVPSIPLAAALALGAALGPTDAVAVTSLKGNVHMTRREDALLSGEALINDASGVVAFQFAIAAAVTDTYEISSLFGYFLLLFFGGILVGAILAVAIRWVRRKSAETGLESTTFYVLVDLLSPFIIYLAAELVSVSGILAVVTAGLILGREEERRIGPSVARLNIVTSSVWELLAFTLNGIIFILLGMELCWINPRIISADALFGGTRGTLLTIAIMTAVLVAIRFLWIFVMERWRKDPDTKRRPTVTKNFLASVAAMTIGGPKGAVTLSIIMSIPYVVASGASFPHRDQLIFLASGIILATLLLATFFLPVLSPKPKVRSNEFEENADMRVDILRNVILRLSDQMNEKNTAATRSVIRMYNDRIKRIGLESEEQDERIRRKLSLDIVKQQEIYIAELMDEGEYDSAVCYRYARRISHREHILTHQAGPGWYFFVVMRNIRRAAHAFMRSVREWMPGMEHPAADAEMRELEIAVLRKTLRYLEGMMASNESEYPPEVLGAEQARYSRAIVNLKRMRPSITYITKLEDNLDDIMREGYYLELQEITQRYENNEISRSLAKTLRENVHLMQLDLEDRL